MSDIRNIHLEDFECPNCGQKTMYASELDADGLPNGTIECVSCGSEYQEAVDVREVHPCETENCTSIETAKYHNQWAEGDDEFEWLCDDHAIADGYCLGCRWFCAGTESYDFSPIKGYCHDCVEEIRYDAGEYDDDFYDDDLDFGWNEYPEWSDIIEGEEGGRYIGEGSETLPDDEAQS